MVNTGSILNLPLVSYQGLQRSSRALQLVVDYYFPLHGLETADYFACHGFLSLFSALIYQTDERTELLQMNAAHEAAAEAGQDLRTTVRGVLGALRLLDSRVEHELAAGARYVEMETRLLQAGSFSHDDLREAMELRSADLRIMHRLVLRQLQRPEDEVLFGLCGPLEVMAEIRDDLYQYHEDQAAGKFNFFAMLQRLYGVAAPDYLLREHEHYRRVFSERMDAAPAPLRERIAPAAKDAFDLSTLPCPPAT